MTAYSSKEISNSLIENPTRCPMVQQKQLQFCMALFGIGNRSSSTRASAGSTTCLHRLAMATQISTIHPSSRCTLLYPSCRDLADEKLSTLRRSLRLSLVCGLFTVRDFSDISRQCWLHLSYTSSSTQLKGFSTGSVSL